MRETGETPFYKKGFPRAPSPKIFKLNGIGVGLSLGRQCIDFAVLNKYRLYFGD